MAVDKLVDSTQLDADLTSVANAIRTKGGTSAQLAFPAGFVSAVQDIPTGTTPTLITKTITENGTYDAEDDNADGYSEVTVNVSGGETVAKYLVTLGDRSLKDAVLADTIFFEKLQSAGQNCFSGITGGKILVFPSFTGPGTTRYPFSDNKSLECIDFGTSMGNIGYGYLFSGDEKLTTVIIRKTSAVVTLNNLNDFNATPFASGGSGGTLYVPSSLIASYQAASNWSTILGYANNQIKSIESTHTDPTAPIDLTLYYADGTPIPTT